MGTCLPMMMTTTYSAFMYNNKQNIIFQRKATSFTCNEKMKRKLNKRRKIKAFNWKICLDVEKQRKKSD